MSGSDSKYAEADRLEAEANMLLEQREKVLEDIDRLERAKSDLSSEIEDYNNEISNIEGIRSSVDSSSFRGGNKDKFDSNVENILVYTSKEMMNQDINVSKINVKIMLLKAKAAELQSLANSKLQAAASARSEGDRLKDKEKKEEEERRNNN